MKDIQSASSVSRMKNHFLLEGSAQLRRQLPQVQKEIIFFHVMFININLLYSMCVVLMS